MNETELLFTDVLECGRVELYLNKDKKIDKDKLFFISSALKRRIKGEPIQYILGKTEFMGLEFKVTPDVLIPRQETEILVETAVKYVTKSPSHQVTGLEIMDLGTGSGCIAVSLAKLLDNVEITAVDISSKSIKIAEYNAALNNVSGKIKFINTDLFLGLCVYEPARYDIIVTNLPYISSGEIDTLQPEIKYEPRLALDGGSDGLTIYRKLIIEAPVYLKECGLLIMEIGFGQKDKIENIFHRLGKFAIIEVIKDYSGIDRVIVAKNIG
jgi:release factor glutamine methyltransferase